MPSRTHKVSMKPGDRVQWLPLYSFIALWPLYSCCGSESESPVLRTGVIWKSGWCCCCITNRSGWLLELLTELTKKYCTAMWWELPTGGDLSEGSKLQAQVSDHNVVSFPCVDQMAWYWSFIWHLHFCTLTDCLVHTRWARLLQIYWCKYWCKKLLPILMKY